MNKLKEKMKQDGVEITHAASKQEEKPEEKKDSFLNKSYSFGGVSMLDVALAVRHLSIMLKSSMSIADAIEVLANQADNPKLQKIFGEVHAEIISGNTLSSAMAKHPKAFSHVVVSVIKVGEAAGTLEKNLIFLADFLKANYELNRKVKGALIYPVIVFGITVFEMLGVIFFILPKLEDLFNSFESQQSLTVFIMATTGFLRENWIAFLIGAIIAVLLLKLFLKTEFGQRTKDRVKLRFPVIKDLTKKHILTNLSRTLSILLESSIPISESLKISADTVDSYVYKQAMLDIHEKVSGGMNVAEAMMEYDKLFPGTYVKMIEIGEQTGTLEENLMYLHGFYAEEVKEISSNLATLLEPLLLIFIGLMIGLLAITIVGPIYQLTGNINP